MVFLMKVKSTRLYLQFDYYFSQLFFFFFLVNTLLNMFCLFFYVFLGEYFADFD